MNVWPLAIAALVLTSWLPGKGSQPLSIAWVSSGRLVMGYAEGRYSSPAPQPTTVYQPAFSHDGRYIAFAGQSVEADTIAEAQPKYLWLAPFCVRIPALPDPHCAAREVKSLGAISTFSWSPTSDTLLVTTQAATTVLVDANRRVIRLHPPNGTQLSLWSPDGNTIAGTSEQHGYSRLILMRHTSASSRPLPGLARYDAAILARWWTPEHVLYWIDPQSSGSIAADGMRLMDLNLRTGHARELGLMLGYQDWLAISGQKLVMVAGGGRSAFYGKHLQLCRLDGPCRLLPGMPARSISVDPAWSPDGGKLLFVVASSWNTFGFKSARRYKSWLHSHMLWIANGNGSHAHPIVLSCHGLECSGPPHSGPVRGVSDPTWTAGGILFEARGGLAYLRSPAAFNTFGVAQFTRTLVPNPYDATYQDWYYGHMDWHTLYAAH